MHYCHAGNSAQLTCNNPQCRVTLQYPRGASQVQCSLCNTINTAIDVSHGFGDNVMSSAVPVEPDLQDAAACFTCFYMSACLAASALSCTHSSMLTQRHKSSLTSRAWHAGKSNRSHSLQLLSNYADVCFWGSFSEMCSMQHCYTSQPQSFDSAISTAGTLQ